MGFRFLNLEVWDLEFWDLGDPRLLFWKVSFSFTMFFHKSVTSDSKRPKSGNLEICSCLLVLSLCLFVLVQPKIQFGEGVISLYKFFTKSVISGSKCPTSKNIDFLDFRDPRILFWEGFIFLYKLNDSTYTLISFCPAGGPNVIDSNNRTNGSPPFEPFGRSDIF